MFLRPSSDHLALSLDLTKPFIWAVILSVYHSTSQQTSTCSKSTEETLKKGVQYVQSYP